MSSTTFGPVFSVGASSHPLETLDTGAEGVGGAQRPRPGPLRPAHAQKIGRCPRPPLAVIQIGRAAIVERLMRPLSVVEPEIAGQPRPRLARVAVVGEIDLL